MKLYSTFIVLLAGFFLFGFSSQAQQTWPKSATGSDGTSLKLYQLQPESFSNNTLKGRAAISITQEGKADPVFGVIWFNAATDNNGDQVKIQSLEITSIKLPGDIDDSKLQSIQELLESKSGEWQIAIASSELNSSLDLNKKETQLSQEINNTPPRIIYSSKPSILVLIDGTPKVQQNTEFGMEAVVNTPFTIVKENGSFFLYGGKHWYTAPAATGPYQLTTQINSKLQKVQQVVQDAGRDDDEGTESDNNTIYNVIVSTDPAELVQSNGEANFAAVDGTNLLYVSNSQNDIFMDVNSQEYYVLLSGRWFKSKTLGGNWQYISSENLPGDFAKIPAGSPKDNVLASVAGTEEAADALEEAQVPQTAKVDRKSARAEIAYDGDPEFQAIDGTDMAYAVNTSASVIRWRGRYYSVDNGVWFESRYASGPWAVSVTRPYAVALIPPRYPVYHMKYVYIYDVTPDYVWMGYTPGYLNTFVYGPTIVYGTGFYYRPWFGHYYYPRPYTWGFGVRYNPWIGWGIGFNYSSGWFNGGFYGARSHWYGGWWGGPAFYRPSYCWSPYRFSGGYYGRNAIIYNNRYRNYNVVNRNYTSNVYRNRGGITTRNYQRTYSPVRRNNSNNWSYNNRANNNNRIRSNNFPGNRVDERANRPVRDYNPARSRDNNGYRNNNDNGNNNRNRYNNNNRDNNNRFNNDNRNNNGNDRDRFGRQNNIQPNSSSRERDATVNPNPSRRTDGWSGSRNGGTERRIESQPGTRPERRSFGSESGSRSEMPRNNSAEQQRTMPGRISQPQRGALIHDQGRTSPRTYQQPMERQSQRRESVSPRSEQRSGGGGGGQRPERGGGDRGGRDGGRRGN